MHHFIFILLLAVGAPEALHWQTLTCNFKSHHESLQRIWCRKSSDECCSGFTFSKSAQSVDGGKLRVTQGSHSFYVAMLEPSHGEGMYWCGVLSKNGSIIKLAERYFYTSSWYIWSHARWILLPLLPMMTIFINVYARVTCRRILMKTAESYDDIGVARPLRDPQNEEPLYELK